MEAPDASAADQVFGDRDSWIRGPRPLDQVFQQESIPGLDAGMPGLNQPGFDLGNLEPSPFYGPSLSGDPLDAVNHLPSLGDVANDGDELPATGTDGETPGEDPDEPPEEPEVPPTGPEWVRPEVKAPPWSGYGSGRNGTRRPISPAAETRNGDDGLGRTTAFQVAKRLATTADVSTRDEA